MAILLKSPDQIEKLRAAGRLVAETYEELRPHVKPGVSTGELDSIAEKFIRGHGAMPIYKGYGAISNRGKLIRPAFPATICVAINDVICHGIPNTHQILQDGDIIGIDIGVIYRGWVGDSCVTFIVGQPDVVAERLLAATQRSLELGIAAAQPGGRIGDIGAAIQKYAEGEGYGVVREYGGHGVGRSLHEDPFVTHVGKVGAGPEIRPGMVFTIEPMLNEGTADTKLAEDGWTVSTADGKRSAQFEHTLAITDNGPEILTTL
ncbi:MAG TPA: type I methionyl aminopeptidase [Ktedonobacterales bacterium]|nr:type I methionyl aminopeptidase [Ktedonobacterales bacterium]